MTYSFRNPVYSSADGQQIDMEIEHPVYGWIPFTARPDDVEQHGRDLFAAAVLDEVSAFSAPEPEPEPVPSEISDRQFFQELANRELITEAEAEDAVASGVIPASLLALVEGLPAGQQFSARMFLKGATRFERGHPMTKAIGFAYGMTSEEIDDLWRSAFAL